VWCDTLNRGVAYGLRQNLLQQADTTLVALDARLSASRVVVEGLRPRQRRDRQLAPLVIKYKVMRYFRR